MTDRLNFYSYGRVGISGGGTDLVLDGDTTSIVFPVSPAFTLNWLPITDSYALNVDLVVRNTKYITPPLLTRIKKFLHDRAQPGRYILTVPDVEGPTGLAFSAALAFLLAQAVYPNLNRLSLMHRAELAREIENEIFDHSSGCHDYVAAIAKSPSIGRYSGGQLIRVERLLLTGGWKKYLKRTCRFLKLSANNASQATSYYPLPQLTTESLLVDELHDNTLRCLEVLRGGVDGTTFRDVIRTSSRSKLTSADHPDESKGLVDHLNSLKDTAAKLNGHGMSLFIFVCSDIDFREIYQIGKEYNHEGDLRIGVHL